MDYPFTALVGQDTLKTALCLIAVNPSIGGLLIRGERGTAKSTAARALAGLLPPLRVVSGCPFNCDPDAIWPGCSHCGPLSERAAAVARVPFVNLPLGATEDRVLGSLDFDRALREGRRSFQPGLLAAANRGILYIDEVNLLADHLVDVLLDAAAAGVNTVQREGISVTHPARFLLVGTMNPEEGELRPQLLDRFGLMVQVTGPREPESRIEIVRRRLEFESDPAAFVAFWTVEQERLRGRLADAGSRLKTIEVSDETRQLISRICCDFEVDGMRPDIVMHKAAQALAALERRGQVTIEDVRLAAELVLPHRCRRRLFEQTGMDREKLDNICRSPVEPADATPPSIQSGVEPPPSKREQRFEAAVPEKVRRVEVVSPNKRPAVHDGRRNDCASEKRGRYVRAIADDKPADLALDATLRSALGRGGFRDGTLSVETSDLQRKEREGKTGTRILFVVDASGSMAARKRMELVKGAAIRLLEDAYRQRDQVGVIAFRGTESQILLPFTSAVEQAEVALRELPTGGRTPLAHALTGAAELLGRAEHSQMSSLLVILSDGKANVSLPGTQHDPWQQTLSVASDLAMQFIPTLVLDSETGFVRAGRAAELSTALGAEYLRLDDLTADDLVLRVQAKRALHEVTS